jgi:hypothetical protein
MSEWDWMSQAPEKLWGHREIWRQMVNRGQKLHQVCSKTEKLEW